MESPMPASETHICLIKLAVACQFIKKPPPCAVWELFPAGRRNRGGGGPFVCRCALLYITVASLSKLDITEPERSTRVLARREGFQVMRRRERLPGSDSWPVCGGFGSGSGSPGRFRA